MKKVLLTLTGLWLGTALYAQEPVEIALWPEGAPNTNGITSAEKQLAEGRVSDVNEPAVYLYLPDPQKSKRTAVVICPGGGYARLAMGHEGHDMAKWLAANGITAYVLKYRMPNQHHEVPLSDAQQALRLARRKALELAYDTDRVGIMGFSAGGHLASTAATHFDAESRPDFALLFYPVITMDPAFTHAGSRQNLLGENPDAALVERYSNEKQVSAETPPTLLFHSDDDRGVPVQNSLWFYEAMKTHGVPGSLYVFPNGGHGWGFRESFRYHEEWKTLLLKWLEDMKFTK